MWPDLRRITLSLNAPGTSNKRVPPIFRAEPYLAINLQLKRIKLYLQYKSSPGPARQQHIRICICMCINIDFSNPVFKALGRLEFQPCWDPLARSFNGEVGRLRFLQNRYSFTVLCYFSLKTVTTKDAYLIQDAVKYHFMNTSLLSLRSVTAFCPHCIFMGYKPLFSTLYQKEPSAY